MHRIMATMRIDASPLEVWELYADVEGSVEWVPFAEQILSVSGPAGLGQVDRERTRLGGIADVAEWTIIARSAGCTSGSSGSSQDAGSRRPCAPRGHDSNPARLSGRT